MTTIEEWREMQDWLAEITGVAMIVRPAADLGGRAELAKLTGARRSSVARALAADGAPRPLLETRAAGKVWSIAEVLAWDDLPRGWRPSAVPSTLPELGETDYEIMVTNARAQWWRALEDEIGTACGDYRSEYGIIARPVADLVGLPEISAVTGRARDALRKVLVVRADHNGPPRPLVHLKAGGYLWSGSEIAAWPGPRGRWGPARPLSEPQAPRTAPVPAQKPKPKPINRNRVVIP